jgi:hypothetical protein
MHSVKVRRTGISPGEAAKVLRDGLGGDYKVQADGDSLLVRKGLARARVSLRAADGGTVFDVSGAGASVLPLFSVVTRLLNDQGIAKRAAVAIGEAAAFRDDS